MNQDLDWFMSGWLSDWTLLARAGACEGQNASSIDDRVSSIIHMYVMINMII